MTARPTNRSRWCARNGRVNFRALAILAALLLLVAVGVSGVRTVRQRAIMTTSLELARAAEQRGDWPAAARAYRRYLEKKKDDVEILRAFARAHLANRPLDTGNLTSARGAFLQLLRYAPADVEAERKLPELRLLLREHEDLIRHARRALETGANPSLAMLWLARGQAGAGSLSDASATLTTLIEGFERDPESAAAQALVVIAAGELRANLAIAIDGADGPHAALTWYARVSNLLPNAAEPVLSRARLRRAEAGRFASAGADRAAARAELERASGAVFVDPLARIELAAEWIEFGEYERARQALDAADRINPTAIADRCTDPEDWTVPRALCEIELALRQSRASDVLPLAQDLLGRLAARRQRLRVLPAVARVFLALGRIADLEPVVAEFSKLRRLTTSGAESDAELLEAQLALAQDRPEIAVRLLEPVVDREPKQLVAWRTLASAYERLDRTKATVEALTNVLRLQPESADAAAALVRAHLKRRDWAAATAAAWLLEQLQPEEVLTRVLRLQVAVSEVIDRAERATSDEWDGLERDLTKLLADHPRRVELHVLAAGVAAERGRADEAEQRLRSAIDACDEPLSARLALVSLLLSQRRAAEAIAPAAEAVEVHPAAMQAWIVLAEVARADGRIDDALAALDRGAVAISLLRDRAALQTRAARIELAADRRADASARLERVAASDPSDSRSRSILLTLPEVLSDRSAATRLLEQLAQALGPDAALCKLHRAMLLLQSSEWRERRSEITQFLTECMTSDMQWPAPVLLLGTLHERRGDLVAAEGLYRGALLRNPAAADVADRMLQLLESQNRLAEAGPLLEKLKLRPRLAASVRLTTALATGAFEEAIEEARARVAADERDPESRLLLARLLYQSRRDAVAALAQLDTLDRIQPGLLPARLLRISILRREDRIEEARTILNADVRDAAVRAGGTLAAYALRAEFLVAIGEIDAAERDYRHMCELSPADGTELLGQFLFDQDRIAEAIGVWRAGLAAAPRASLEKRLMKTLMLQPGASDRTEGLKLLEQLERAHPDDPELMRIRAFVLRETGGQAGARQAAALLEKAIAIAPSSVDAHRGLITLSMERGEMSAARDQAVRALGANPNEISLLALRAAAELAQGNAPLARELAKSILKSAPRHADARVILVKAAIAIGEKSALADAERLVGVVAPPAGGDEDAVLAHARLLHALGRTSEAIEFVDSFRATTGGESSLAARLLLVDLSRARGRLDDATSHLNAAAALAPADLDVGRRRIALLAQAGQWGALADFVSAVDPRDPGRRAIYLAGAAALAGSDSATACARAVELFSRIAADGDAIDAHLGLAYALARAGDAAGAETTYRSILERDSRNIRAINELSCILARQENGKQAALDLANRGLAIEPSNDFLLDTRGAILARLDNRQREARISFERAAAVRRNQPAALARTMLQLADVCLQLNDRAAARRAVNEVRELNEKHGVLNQEQLDKLKELARRIEDGGA